MGFWIRYLMVAAVGTLLVYSLAPAVAGRGARPAAPPQAGNGAEPDLAALPPDETAETAAASEPVRAPARPPPEPRPLRTAAPAAAFTPSTDRIPPSGAGVTFWAVTVAGAPRYSTEGRRVANGDVPAGALAELTGSVTAAGGEERALCRVHSAASGWSDPCQIALADLFRVPGTRADVPAETVDLLLRYFGLRGRLDARTRAVAVAAPAAGSDANPYVAEYRAAYRSYEAFHERVKALTARRDAAAGMERMRYMDQLRSMIPEGKRLERAYTAVAAKYRDWKSRNPSAAARPPPAQVTDDPETQRIRTELAQIRPQLAEIGVE